MYFEETTETAVQAAITLNEEFSKSSPLVKRVPRKTPGRLSFLRHANEFIEQSEKRDPSLLKKDSWKTYRTYILQVSRAFDGRSVNKVGLLDLQAWWDKLSGNAQRSRKAILRKFYNHLLARKLCPQLEANPFTNDDSRPKLAMKAKPARKRLRLSIGQFWAIYEKAGELNMEFLQLAMKLSLITTMRRGDLCQLTFGQHVTGNYLRKQISKSHAQLSAAEFKARPSNLSWNLEDHVHLKKVVNNARELSLKHGRCPFLISTQPARRVRTKKKSHTHQVMPDFLTRAFNRARDATELFKAIHSTARPTFHEIRSLSSHMYKKAGYQASEVQILMAHTDEKITEHYQAGHETQWSEIGLMFTDEMLQPVNT